MYRGAAKPQLFKISLCTSFISGIKFDRIIEKREVTVMKTTLYVNAKPTKEDEEMTRLFKEAVKAELKKSKLMGLPIAKYDGRKKESYLEYPDGRRKYGF